MGRQSFASIVQKIYFDVDISSQSAESILKDFRKLKLLDEMRPGTSWSLSIATALPKMKDVKKRIYIFRMLQSPLSGQQFDDGFIKVHVADSGDAKKLLNVEWCVQLQREANAHEWFEYLRQTFNAVSIELQSDEDEGLDDIKLARFSSRSADDERIRDVILSLGKSPFSSFYELHLSVFNELKYDN